MGKRQQLEALTEEVRRLEGSPLYAYRQEHDYQMVFGTGDPEAQIMFIGEAPGKKEAESGRPFIGPSGGVLDELLDSIGLQREEVYITNVVKDRPPDNRDPRQEEVKLYKPFLLRQIEIIQPQVIATLGRFAMDFILKEFDMEAEGSKISQLHGRRLSATASYGTISVVPLYHPAVALYNRNQHGTLEADFATLRAFL